MKTVAILAIIGAILCGIFGYGAYAYINAHNQQEPVAQAIEPAEQAPQPPTPEEILQLVNEERAKVGVPPLQVFEPAMQSAQFKAEDMATRNYFAHTAPGTDRNNGLDYLYEIDNNQCRIVNENIRRNGDDNSSQAALDGWKNSEPHYKAMVDPRYVFTGVGVYGHMLVQHFCIPY